MKSITTNQIIAIHSLLPVDVKTDKELKAALMVQYTGSESKASTKDLTYHQAQELIRSLKSKSMDTKEMSSDKMRKKIISMAHDMGWQYVHPTYGKLCADMKAINQWCIKYGYLHKPLDKYAYEELPTLVSQFETLYAQRMTK